MKKLCLSIIFAVLTATAAHAQAPLPDVDALTSAIVHIRMKAVDSARSNANLGREREGTGIVIDGDGHIVTIGYVVVEAESVEVVTQDQKTVAARLIGYDHATGLGLLRAVAPLDNVTPIPMGSADALAVREPVLVLPHGGRANASMGYIMSKRRFTASWEYLLDGALFVSPPTMQWAGAALLNREGRLVGIGSLLLRAVSTEHPVPGNMFVPVDALKPILADLIARGTRAGAARPWLGLGTEEVQGHLFVTNVSAQGPAEAAGIRAGDIVVGVGREPVRTHEQLYKSMWSIGAAGVEVPLRVLQGTEVRDIRVRSIDRNEHFRVGIKR
jgi:serine protease Do